MRLYGTARLGVDGIGRQRGFGMQFGSDSVAEPFGVQSVGEDVAHPSDLHRRGGNPPLRSFQRTGFDPNVVDSDGRADQQLGMDPFAAPRIAVPLRLQAGQRTAERIARIDVGESDTNALDARPGRGIGRMRIGRLLVTRQGGPLRPVADASDGHDRDRRQSGRQQADEIFRFHRFR